jgi:serine/threonine protein phosphatase 1
LFIHANLEPAVPLEQQSAEWLRWTHLTGLESPHDSGKRVLCGHTPQKSGLPLVLPGWVGLDTYAWGGGWLTALEVGSNTVFQARQRGDFRTFPLGGEPPGATPASQESAA